jgi:hypothetical protein
MSGSRFLFSALAICIGLLVVEAFSRPEIAFAQSIDWGELQTQ